MTVESPIVEDCLAAIEKALRRAVEGEVHTKKTRGSAANADGADVRDSNLVEYEFSSAGAPEREVALSLVKAMIKATCGEEKGMLKLRVRNLAKMIPIAMEQIQTNNFAELVKSANLAFDLLPSDQANVSAIAELAYMRYIRKQLEPMTCLITSFPKCLLRTNGISRVDVVMANYVVLSMTTAQNTMRTLRVFTRCVEAVFTNMCGASFIATVLPEKWNNLFELTVSQLNDVIEDAQLSISEFWNDSAQDDQAKTETTLLLSTISAGLLEYFKAYLRNTHFRNGSDKLNNNDNAESNKPSNERKTNDIPSVKCLVHEGRSLLDQALMCIEDWTSSCTRLTTLEWGRAYGAPFIDSALELVKTRIRDVFMRYSVLNEARELIFASELTSWKLENRLWDVFNDVDLFNTESTQQVRWENALAAFDRQLYPIRQRCATILRDRLTSQDESNATNTSNPLSTQAMLSEFVRFKQLIQHPDVAKELTVERESVLTRVQEQLQTIRIEFERRADSTEDENLLAEEDRKCQPSRYLPGVVNHLICVRQWRSKVQSLRELCESVLSDLAGTKSCLDEASDLIEDITDYEQETFRNWTMSVMAESDELTLDASAPLLTINQDGLVRVNYPERLVSLLKEVRVFGALNYHVPQEILRIARVGRQYYSKGIALRQVASVYNTMARDIIPCTRAMLLESAVAFEKVITATGNRRLTWKSTEEADRFIEQLREACSVLTEDNRTLHHIHREIKNIVVNDLFSIDLLRSQERWLDKVRLIREKIEHCGFSNTQAWRKYWDAQLYKAFEYQYLRGLESLHESITEIKVDVVYDAITGRAALKPALEVVKQQYYDRVREFITLPARLQSCSECAAFRQLPSHSEQAILTVMKHASQLFIRLQRELKRLTPLLILGRCGKAGNPALEAIVSKALTEVQHWEQAFRLVKQRGKEINACELFIKCGCITLCTANIKSVAEEHLSKLTDVLKVTLRRSAETHLDQINEFLNRVDGCLSGKLTKLDEIGQANVHYAALMEERSTVEVEFLNFTSKNVLLRGMTGTAGLGVDDTKTRWAKLITRLESHEKEMEEQLAELKESVQVEVQKWDKNVERFANQWEELKPQDLNATNALEFVKQKAEELRVLREAGEEYKKQCAYFEMDDFDTHHMEELTQNVEEYVTMWEMLSSFQQELSDLAKEPWISFRAKLYRFDDFVKAWPAKLRSLANNSVVIDVRTKLDQYARTAPVFKFVRGDGFTSSHWTELFNILSIHDRTQDTITFGDILDKHDLILSKEEVLKKLYSRAQGEAQIREALADVRLWAKEAHFELIPHPDRPGVQLISEWKDTLTAVSDNQALLMSMKDSPYFSLFANDASRWEERLSTLDDYLHHMNQIQRRWVYLEPIFRRGALSNEQPRFERIDKEYLQIMKVISADSHLLSLAAHSEYKTVLRDILDQLEHCQKSLNQFLEDKRDRFPRFYFISDDDLLEILAQSKNPTVIQTHLKKLFMGIYRVQFDANQENILRVYSLEGEIVTLNNPVHVTDEVETWLRQLDSEMKSTLQMHLVQCVQNADIGAYAAQIICTAEMINFTRKVEEALRHVKTGAVIELKKNLESQLRELTTFAGSNTDVIIGLKLKALIMDLIHNIAVVKLLIENKVESANDWLWRKQLRFYLDKDNLCVLRMVNASFCYSYEYQGNAPKLVHTPLTDKCYLTLTQGMHLGYGGNPYGPAGTGKTESVKALGNAMGRQVLVFNCDEGIDFKSMGRIFTGLVKCGAWGCFDEFNRLKIDQLSAISQMIQVIQEALKNKDANCALLGREIEVNNNAGIFVTMNPAGKGYGGRTKLPDNLKQLFRSLAMSVPDNELIMETILLSEGFVNATDLSRRLVEMFTLCAQLLSQQQHYDWGLRAMKTVLRLGGSLIHNFLTNRVVGKLSVTDSEVYMTECEIIIKSLRVNTLSKLTFDDAVLFNDLLSDIFPGVAIHEIEYTELRPAIVESINELNLELVETQVSKVLQFYEALNQRMGVVLVGPSGSGKSTLIRILRRALQRLGQKLPIHVVNPKALPREQLLGRMDADTREWFDGVITSAARQVVMNSNDVHSWILCDGDIDPEWIESLNSVLDDNKLLTMPNGVRIQFGSNINFIFETHSLEFASPATVSRMGIIYLSEEDVDAKSAVASWLREQAVENRTQLGEWIDEYFYKAIDLLLSSTALVVETTKVGLVMSGLSQLHGCTCKEQFACALVYGLGSYLPESARSEYAKEIMYLTNTRIPDASHPLDFYFDNERDCYARFEYELSFELSMEELHREPMVATVECQRALCVMKAWLHPVKNGVYRPFILVGPEGCGKTMLMHNLFANRSNTRVATVNCSAQTRAIHVIQKLKQMCQMFNSSNGKVLRPKEAECLVLLLKDLNLPKPDRYGTVQLHSLLQQLIVYNGFYDADLEWVTIERIQIVGSMNPPGSTGRYPVSPRLLAITSILSIDYPSREALQLIYTEFLTAIMHHQRSKLPIPGKGPNDVAKAMIAIYESVTTKYTVDVASHYVFNPRDLTQWALNLLHYDGAHCMDAIEEEARRLFVDRLIMQVDRDAIERVIRDSLSSLQERRAVANVSREINSPNGIYISWKDASPIGKRLLQPSSLEEVQSAVELAVRNYSREYGDLTLPLLPSVCAWLAHIDRVLSQERGHLLLIAQSGMCATEMVKVIGYNNHSEVMMLNITREYGVKHFVAELKAVMCKAGVEGQSTILLLEDFNFFEPSFMETVNSVLAAGEVPGMFSAEEQETLLGPLKEDALSEGLSAYAYFLQRIARFLHVVVVLDPTHPLYEIRCRANPALFTRCNVYWLGTWTEKSLQSLPTLLYPEMFHTMEGTAESGKKGSKLVARLVEMHQSEHKKYSPQHFLTLCHTYERIFVEQSSRLKSSVARLKNGVAKLDEAQENVDCIAAEVQKSKKLLETKQSEADEALVQIQNNMAEATDQKKSIHKVQIEIDKEQHEIAERKKVIEQRLSGIQPVLDAAVNSVSAIRAEHLVELKSMKQPPAAVQDVMQAVILLINGGKLSDHSWAAIRKVLAGDIKGQILNYNIDAVDPAARNEVEKYINNNANSFKREVIGRASRAAAPMAEWLGAVIEYSKVLETVAPMRAELLEYEENIRKGEAKKAKYEAKLKKVEQMVEKLKKEFGAKTAEAERLKDEVQVAEETLLSARNLIAKLDTEHARWLEQVKKLEMERKELPWRCLMCAGVITYLGNETEEVRQGTVSGWQEKLPLTEPFVFFNAMREESMQLKYKAEGLSVDELSMDNAVMVEEQINTPLIIDPAGQASAWLLTHLANKKVTVDTCNISDERLVSSLELALRFGKKFIITDVDHIEPFLYAILRKEIRNEGNKRVIQIGDRRTVEYGDGFQLYLLTRSTEMHVAPDIRGFLTLINFSITRSGLENQFLGITIQHEQPELEAEKIRTLQKEEELKLRLMTLEERLLEELANSSGSLLDNSTLVDSLNEIKTQATQINDALAKSHDLQQEIDTKRNVFRPFASIASVVFFATKTLKELSHMYEFSFNAFLDLFNSTLASHKELRTDPETKIAHLQETFIQRTVAYVARSLLKEHRVIFGVHLMRALDPDAFGKFEWDFFVDKAVAVVVTNSPTPSAATSNNNNSNTVNGNMSERDSRAKANVPTFVSPDSVELFHNFASLFPQLLGKLHLHEADVWLRWMRTASPEMEYPPFLAKLTPCQKLLVMKVFRADRLTAAMNLIACTALHVDSLGENASIASLIADADAHTPVLLITTTGSDPSQELQIITHNMVGKDHFHQLAMGGGQTNEAIRLIRSAAEVGDWVFLKNLHLVIDWVPVLHKELHMLTPHKKFRLFLTSEAHDAFPSSLLAQSIKVAFESPPGVHQSLSRTYHAWGKAYYDSLTNDQQELLFLVAAFHAIVQERRNYIPQGWTKMYEITAADLTSASNIIVQQMNQKEIDWKSIKGLLESAVYGGKMETAVDTRVLLAYIDKFFCSNLLSHATRQQSAFLHVRVPSGGFASILNTIKSLPSNDIPAMFDLPANAERIMQQTKMRSVMFALNQLHELRTTSVTSREERAAALMPVLQSWATLASAHSDLLTHHLNASRSLIQLSSSHSRVVITPLARFVAAELATALQLVANVNACVDDLRSVIDGVLLLTESRRAEANCLVKGDVPEAWQGAFPCSSRVLGWMQALLRRAVALSRWSVLADNDNLLQTPLNLSNMMRARTFLNALRQQAAHTLKEPLISLSLHAVIGTSPNMNYKRNSLETFRKSNTADNNNNTHKVNDRQSSFDYSDSFVYVEVEGLLLQGAVLDDEGVLQPIETADEASVFPICKAWIGWRPRTTKSPTSTSVTSLSVASPMNALASTNTTTRSSPTASTTSINTSSAVNNKSNYKNNATVNVPIFANATREDYICEVALPCTPTLSSEAFILAGVAIILEQ